MQIVQFIIDVAVIYAILIANNIYKIAPNFILAYPCSGNYINDNKKNKTKYP